MSIATSKIAGNSRNPLRAILRIRQQLSRWVPFVVLRLNMVVSLLLRYRQPGDLGILRGAAECVAEEAKTRGFASLALARFAFFGCSAN
jgi:hypothetical protein